MPKEIHIFNDINIEYEQSHLFIVDRNEENKTISVTDMFTVTLRTNGLIKNHINFPGLINKIIETPGGSVQGEDMLKVLEVFGDLVPKEIFSDFKIQKLEQELERATADMWIRASEAAVIAHPITLDFDHLAKNVKK